MVVLAHGGLGEPPWRPGYSGYQARADLGPENFVSRLAREVGGIDVILAGHSHEEVRGHQLGGSLVVQAGDRATSVAVVRVTLSSEQGRVTVTSKTADLISTRGVAPSDEILELVREDEQTARLARFGSRFQREFTYYKTEETLTVANREVRGLGLPADVLDQLYSKSAAAWYPGVL